MLLIPLAVLLPQPEGHPRQIIHRRPRPYDRAQPLIANKHPPAARPAVKVDVPELPCRMGCCAAAGDGIVCGRRGGGEPSEREAPDRGGGEGGANEPRGIAKAQGGGFDVDEDVVELVLLRGESAQSTI